MAARKTKRAQLDDEEAIEILEAIARDENAKPYERLNAIAQLERRRKPKRAAGAPAEVDEDASPDPMSDLDELGARRRARRGA